jgi:hypothetical protein
MSTLSVATISGVTTLTGGGFDQIGASANSANAAAIASLTTANLALLTANIAKQRREWKRTFNIQKDQKQEKHTAKQAAAV